MAVTRCVCFQTTFRDLLTQARENGWSNAAEISISTRCGLGCGGCRPYLQAMIDTGATCFRVKMDAEPPVPCKPEPWDIH